MKTCDECKKSYPIEAIVCLDCEEILEEWSYVKFVWISLVLSLVIDVALVQIGIFQRWRISEIFQLTGLFVFVGYPLLKIGQKLRDRERPILRELGSIYTGRFDRVLILTLILGVALAGSGLVTLPGALGTSVLVNPEHRPIYRALATVVGAIASVASLAMIIDQGWSFFDFRVKNTYVARERAGN